MESAGTRDYDHCREHAELCCLPDGFYSVELWEVGGRGTGMTTPKTDDPVLISSLEDEKQIGRAHFTGDMNMTLELIENL